VLGDQGNLAVNAKMVDRRSQNRAVGRQGGQGTREEFLPRAGVAGRGIDHPAPRGAIRADPIGEGDEHGRCPSRE
jgi:hypothetical protein